MITLEQLSIYLPWKLKIQFPKTKHLNGKIVTMTASRMGKKYTTIETACTGYKPVCYPLSWVLTNDCPEEIRDELSQMSIDHIDNMLTCERAGLVTVDYLLGCIPFGEVMSLVKNHVWIWGDRDFENGNVIDINILK